MSTLRAPSTAVNPGARCKPLSGRLVPVDPPAITPVVIFAPSFTRRLQNPRFGILPQRDRRLPVGPSAADMEFAKGECPSTACTDAEWRDELSYRTMSAAEFADFTAQARSAMRDRFARADQAEWDELGIDPSRMDELAGTADAVDRMSSGYPLF